MIEPWLDVKGISKHLGLSKETIYRMLERKTIPCSRVGKKWMFKASIVDSFIIGEGSGTLENIRVEHRKTLNTFKYSLHKNPRQSHTNKRKDRKKKSSV